MDEKDSKPISDLSHDELIEYFGPKPKPKLTVVVVWSFCGRHLLWFIDQCPRCGEDDEEEEPRLADSLP